MIHDDVKSWQRAFDQVVEAKQSVVKQLEKAESRLARVRLLLVSWRAGQKLAVENVQMGRDADALELALTDETPGE